MAHYWNSPDKVIAYFEMLEEDGRAPNSSSYDCLIKAYPNALDFHSLTLCLLPVPHLHMNTLTPAHIHKAWVRSKSEGSTAQDGQGSKDKDRSSGNGNK
jgi:hypothetical protein